MNADTLNRILATVEQRSDVVGTGQGMQTVVGGGGVHSFGDDGPLVGFWAKIVARIETLEGPFIPSYTWTQVIEQGDGSFYGDPDTENYAIGGPGVDHADGQQLLDANTPRLPAFEINGEDAKPDSIVRMYWGGGPWLYFARATEVAPVDERTFVSNVCPIFGTAAAPGSGGATIHVVTGIKVEYTFPDGSKTCVTNPTGCCPGSGSGSGGDGIATTCCPGRLLPRELCLTLTAGSGPFNICVGFPTPVSVMAIYNDANSEWEFDYEGPFIAPFDNAFFVGALKCDAGVWAINGSIRCPGEPGVVAPYIKSFPDGTTDRGTSIVSGPTCSPSFEIKFAIEGPDEGDGNVLVYAEFTENLAACGGGGCTGVAYGPTHALCCPGTCWPSDLTLTITSTCGVLEGVPPLTLGPGTALWSSLSFNYDGRVVHWEFSCVDAAGGEAAGMQLSLFYNDDDTEAGFAVATPTCGPPPSVSGTLTINDGSLCDGETVSWSVTV